jgi:hypothetical protein
MRSVYDEREEENYLCREERSFPGPHTYHLSYFLDTSDQVSYAGFI